MWGTVAGRYGLKVDGRHLGDEPVVENASWRPGSLEPRGITPAAYTLVVTLTRAKAGALSEVETWVGLPTRDLHLHLCECGLLMLAGLREDDGAHAGVHETWLGDRATR